MSDTNETEATKDSLEERAEAATDNRTLAEIEEEEKTPSPADSEAPSPDATTSDRKDAGDPM